MVTESAVIHYARAFAKRAHKDQKRKYTGDPYVSHCIEVAEYVRSVPHNEAMIAASLLHDTVEDTEVTYAEIYDEFGASIANLVREMTHVSKPEDGPRAYRKKMDRDFLSRVSADAQTIKLADMISNTASIAIRDPEFAKVYLPEMVLLLQELRRGDITLWRIVAFMLEELGYIVNKYVRPQTFKEYVDVKALLKERNISLEITDESGQSSCQRI